MSRPPADPQVDALLASARPWVAEMRALRAVLRDAALEETIKWRWPCYTSTGRNIVLIHAFKAYCALLFFEGARLADPERLLIRQTENVQTPRQMRFTSLEEIEARRAAILGFVAEAAALAPFGPKPAAPTTAAPPEWEAALAASPALAAAFAALTPGRRRAYLLHFTGAKQEKTRAARVAACASRILAGQGLDD